MSDTLKDLISKLLDRKASTRLGSNGDVNEILSHPFFADIDFEKLQRKEILPPYMPDAEQMTLKEAELKDIQTDHSQLKDIKTEDDQDDISAEKKLLISKNQLKFSNF